MKWSWRVGTVAGIGLYVHGTFLLLVGWVGLTHWLHGGSAAAERAIDRRVRMTVTAVLREPFALQADQDFFGRSLRNRPAGG